jgi:hypothetical protein
MNVSTVKMRLLPFNKGIKTDFQEKYSYNCGEYFFNYLSLMIIQ